MNKVDLFRLTYRTQRHMYNWAERRWQRVWSLESLAIAAANFPMCRTYFTGHVKPSLTDSGRAVRLQERRLAC